MSCPDCENAKLLTAKVTIQRNIAVDTLDQVQTHLMTLANMTDGHVHEIVLATSDVVAKGIGLAGKSVKQPEGPVDSAVNTG